MTWLCAWFDAPNAAAHELERFVDFVDSLLQLVDSIELEHADLVNGRLRFLCSDKAERDKFILSLTTTPLLGQKAMLIENHLPRDKGPGYAFYSERMASEEKEYKVWRGEDGSEVRVTGVFFDEQQNHGEYVGRVVGFLRKESL
jgi:hypothetical protein